MMKIPPKRLRVSSFQRPGTDTKSVVCQISCSRPRQQRICVATSLLKPQMIWWYGKWRPQWFGWSIIWWSKIASSFATCTPRSQGCLDIPYRIHAKKWSAILQTACNWSLVNCIIIYLMVYPVILWGSIDFASAFYTWLEPWISVMFRCYRTCHVRFLVKYMAWKNTCLKSQIGRSPKKVTWISWFCTNSSR